MSTYQLPARQSRGKRMRQAIEDEEEAADNEFWQQEFFAEEAQDIDYQSEAESEDVPDSDFDESVSEGDSEGEDEPTERRSKALKPPGAPGARKPPLPKKPKVEAEVEGSPPAGAPAPRAARVKASPPPESYEAPRLRRSTKQRTEDAEVSRRLAEATKPRRKAVTLDNRVLTQEELLAEAARTEVENLASLKLLLAREEDAKRRATLVKKRYTGPTTKWRSVGMLRPTQAAQADEGEPAAEAPSSTPAGGADGAAVAANGAAAPGPSSSGQAEGDAAMAIDANAGAGQAEGAGPSGATAADGAQQQGQQLPERAAAEASPSMQRVEYTYMQPLNMKALPRWLRPRRAALQPAKPLCAITGAPARYCDPLTHQYFSTPEAFRELRRRAGRPLAAPLPRKEDAGASGDKQATQQQLGVGGVLFGVGAAQASLGSAQQPAALYTDNVMALIVEFAQHQAAQLHL